MVALLMSQSRFKAVGSLSRNDLNAGWARALRAMRHAINMLRSNVGIDSPALLSSPLAHVALGCWAEKREYRPSGDEVALMCRYILMAYAKDRWSRGASESTVDQGLAVLPDGGGPQQLLDRLISQVGQLEIHPGDLEGRNSRSALFKTMFLAFAEDGLQDWWSKLSISVKHAGAQDRLQFHHIFSKAYLRKCDPDIKGSLVDDIANLAFMGGKANRSISDGAPSGYLTKLAIEQSESLSTQQVPLASDMYDFDHYEEFFRERLVLIAQRLNTFMA
jgi:hypothetical protein